MSDIIFLFSSRTLRSVSMAAGRKVWSSSQTLLRPMGWFTSSISWWTVFRPPWRATHRWNHTQTWYELSVSLINLLVHFMNILSVSSQENVMKILSDYGKFDKFKSLLQVCRLHLSFSPPRTMNNHSSFRWNHHESRRWWDTECFLDDVVLYAVFGVYFTNIAVTQGECKSEICTCAMQSMKIFNRFLSI